MSHEHPLEYHALPRRAWEGSKTTPLPPMTGRECIACGVFFLLTSSLFFFSIMWWIRAAAVL